MQYTRETAVHTLLEGYRPYFNITMFEGERKPLTAICEFFERSEKYVVSRQAKLWTANCEEFVYLFDVERLTRDVYERCRDEAYEDGMKRANIGPGHMYTYITPVFVCDSCDDEARKAVKKCRIYKSFRFSLHGWMDFHVAVLEVSDGNRITTNRSGRCVEEILKNVLSLNKKKRRRVL